MTKEKKTVRARLHSKQNIPLSFKLEENTSVTFIGEEEAKSVLVSIAEAVESSLVYVGENRGEITSLSDDRLDLHLTSDNTIYLDILVDIVIEGDFWCTSGNFWDPPEDDWDPDKGWAKSYNRDILLNKLSKINKIGQLIDQDSVELEVAEDAWNWDDYGELEVEEPVWYGYED